MNELDIIKAIKDESPIKEVEQGKKVKIQLDKTVIVIQKAK